MCPWPGCDDATKWTGPGAKKMAQRTGRHRTSPPLGMLGVTRTCGGELGGRSESGGICCDRSDSDGLSISASGAAPLCINWSPKIRPPVHTLRIVLLQQQKRDLPHGASFSAPSRDTHRVICLQNHFISNNSESAACASTKAVVEKTCPPKRVLSQTAEDPLSMYKKPPTSISGFKMPVAVSRRSTELVCLCPLLIPNTMTRHAI